MQRNQTMAGHLSTPKVFKLNFIFCIKYSLLLCTSFCLVFAGARIYLSMQWTGSGNQSDWNINHGKVLTLTRRDAQGSRSLRPPEIALPQNKCTSNCTSWGTEHSQKQNQPFHPFIHKAMGEHWDQSHRIDGGHVLSVFRAQLLITMEGQQNLICHRWLNTPSRMTT